jgi:hypothetical protein
MQVSDEFQIFDMRFVKTCAATTEIVKGREGNVGVPNKVQCLKQWSM